MNIYYSVGFSIKDKSGRAAGTINKAKELGKKTEKFAFTSCYFANKSPYLVFKILNSVILIVIDTWNLVTSNPRYHVVILRDNVFFPVRLAKFFGASVCIEVHAAAWEEVGGNRVKQLFKSAYKKLFLRILRNADIVIYNTYQIKNHFRENYNIRARSIVSYNGASPELVENKESPSVIDFKKTFKKKEGVSRLVYAGNIRPWHNMESIPPLIEELSKLQNIELLIVGGAHTTYSRAIQEMFKKIKGCHVINEGQQEILLAAIKSADYCLLPTASDRSSPGSPVKLFDYLVCGKKVITQTDTPGYSDVVLLLKAGICVDFNDPKSAARLISSRISKVDELDEELRIREEVLKHHSWSARMTLWVNTFSELRLH